MRNPGLPWGEMPKPKHSLPNNVPIPDVPEFPRTPPNQSNKPSYEWKPEMGMKEVQKFVLKLFKDAKNSPPPPYTIVYSISYSNRFIIRVV